MKKRFPWLTILSDEFDRISTIQFSKSLAGRIKGSKREAAKPSSITNLASPREARYIGRFNLNCLFNPGIHSTIEISIKIIGRPRLRGNVPGPNQTLPSCCSPAYRFSWNNAVFEWLDSFAFSTSFSFSSSFSL